MKKHIKPCICETCEKARIKIARIWAIKCGWISSKHFEEFITFISQKMTDFHDKVQEAAEQLKKALEDMGCESVTVVYAYSKNKSTHTGGTFHNIIQAVGALEIMKHDLLNDKET